MGADEIEELLDRRQSNFNSVEVEDSLSSSVNADKFYEYVASIEDINISGNSCHVNFYEPETGVSGLGTGYGYTVAVSRGQTYERYKRSNMPRKALITLHQVAIVIWAMATGEI